VRTISIVGQSTVDTFIGHIDRVAYVARRRLWASDPPFCVGRWPEPKCGAPFHAPTAMNTTDELAIRSLLAGYSDAVMCGDAAAAASVFADDGVLSAFGGPDVVSRPAIEAALTGRLGGRGGGFSVQMLMTVGVLVDGDRAEARSHYLEASRGADPGVGRLSMGSMEDRLNRSPDGWRIVHRRLARVYVGDLDMHGRVTQRNLIAWLWGPEDSAQAP